MRRTSILIAAVDLASGRNPRRFVSSLSTKNHQSMAACTPGSSAISSHFDRLRSNNRELLFLDGGTGEELFRRGVPDDRKIWSATAVVNEKFHPVLRDVHRSFVDAGSDAITTNSYGIVPGVGFSQSDVAKYVGIAGSLARESVNGRAKQDNVVSPRSTIVFGSLGPLVESYRPDKVMEHLSGVAYYSIMAKALAPNVDCFLAETMSSFEESSQAMEAVGSLPAESKLPMMVSWTLNSDGILRSGEPVVEAIRNLADFANQHSIDLLGVLFNCAEPESITKALEQIHRDKELQTLLDDQGIILGAYANRLTPVAEDWSLAESEEAQAMRKDVSPADYFNRFVNIWVRDLGVQMVGGCCGITPEHIAYLCSHLRIADGK